MAVLLSLSVVWIYNDLREKIGISATVSEDEKNALTFAGEPIVPRHERPEGIPQDGFDVLPQDHLLFEDFHYFADRLNKAWEEDHWRIQEDKKSSFLMEEEIRYGRQYSIFCNAQKMGWLRLASGMNYSQQNPQVPAEVWMANVRLLPPKGVLHFFDTVSRFICSTNSEIANNE